MNDKISLAGDLGSGKSTVGAILKDRLGFETYSTGAIVREVAARRGMTVGELNVYMETHPEIDHEIDDGLVRLSKDERSLIIDSRMAWHFTQGTFRLYLSTDLETSAARIMGANRSGEHADTLEQTKKETFERRQSEKKRYMEQYGVDIKDLTNYDFVIDTTSATPAEIADAICDAFAKWQKDKSYRGMLLCPERLFVPDLAVSKTDLAAAKKRLAQGQSSPVTVTEKDGSFYLVSGLADAYVALMDGAVFLPALLVKQPLPDCMYIRLNRSSVC